MLNGLRVVGKDIGEVRLVTAGAGAAALACLDLLIELGLRRENITVTDIAGVVYEGRTEEMDPYKARFAGDTAHRTLEQALAGADIFLGLSAGGVLKPEWCPDGGPPPDPGAGQPSTRDRPGGGQGGTPRCHHCNRPLGLPESGQQRLLLPLSIPGCPGCGATEINGP